MKNKRRTRQDIINDLNQPNFMERIKMKEGNLTWPELRQKLGIKIYK